MLHLNAVSSKSVRLIGFTLMNNQLFLDLHVILQQRKLVEYVDWSNAKGGGG